MQPPLQQVDLYLPIVASRPGPPPLTLRVGVKPNTGSTMDGPQQGTVISEVYVLLSALPTEMQERIKLACQAVIAGR